MPNPWASVVILSYNRIEFVQLAIRSARSFADFPCEIIVHDDGSENGVQDILHGMLQAREFSKLIMNPPGENQGVGEAVRAGFSAASGDWLVKADQDLIFKPGWLREAVSILQRPVNVAHAAREEVGMVGLFHYHHEPAASAQMLLHRAQGFQIHKDFVSSAFVIDRAMWERYPWETHSDAFAEDIGFKEKLRDGGYALALPDQDLAENRGFGVGPSTVVPSRNPDGSYVVATIHHEPVIFRSPTPTTPNEARVEMGLQPIPTPPPEFKVGIVIPTCPGREDNLTKVLNSLDEQTITPKQVVIVYDGCPAWNVGPRKFPIRHVSIAKHHPGQEQPRNVGVRQLQAAYPEANFVWFIDSDVVVEPNALREFAEAHQAQGEESIMLGPYEWLAPGQTGMHPETRNDGRWEVGFGDHGREHVLRGKDELGTALACFGGNIVYPIADFARIGGFHPDLHHGRCEDGELGLRAMSLGCGVSFVAKARGYHQWHAIDLSATMVKNARDVPKLNAMHPWVEEKGLIVTAEDGARFEFVCPKCHEQMNCLLMWAHRC